MRLPQANVTGGCKGDHLGTYDSQYGAILSLKSLGHEKSFSINEENSFAELNGENRYAVATEPHSYDILSGFAYVRDRVWIIDKKGRKVKRLKDGDWTFHLSLRDKLDNRLSRDFHAEYRTFYNNPIVHGPPNKKQ